MAVFKPAGVTILVDELPADARLVFAGIETVSGLPIG